MFDSPGYTSSFNESTIEQAALAWFESLGWATAHGPEIAPGERAAERDDYGAVVLEGRLRGALARLNPGLPVETLDDALRKLINPEGATLEARNRAFHRMLVDGVTVECRTAEGDIRGAQAMALDFGQVERNSFVAVNQYTVIENKLNCQADVVRFRVTRVVEMPEAFASGDSNE